MLVTRPPESTSPTRPRSAPSSGKSKSPTKVSAKKAKLAKAINVIKKAIANGTVQDVLWGRDWEKKFGKRVTIEEPKHENKYRSIFESDKLSNLYLNDVDLWNSVLMARIMHGKSSLIAEDEYFDQLDPNRPVDGFNESSLGLSEDSATEADARSVGSHGPSSGGNNTGDGSERTSRKGRKGQKSHKTKSPSSGSPGKRKKSAPIVPNMQNKDDQERKERNSLSSLDRLPSTAIGSTGFYYGGIKKPKRVSDIIKDNKYGFKKLYTSLETYDEQSTDDSGADEHPGERIDYFSDPEVSLHFDLNSLIVCELKSFTAFLSLLLLV
jgi:hypothetical protein